MSQTNSSTQESCETKVDILPADLSKLNFGKIKTLRQIESEPAPKFKSPKDEFRKMYLDAILVYNQELIETLSNRYGINAINKSKETPFWSTLDDFVKDLFDYNGNENPNFHLDFSGSKETDYEGPGNGLLPQVPVELDMESTLNILNAHYINARDNNELEPFSPSAISKKAFDNCKKKLKVKKTPTINKSNWSDWWKIEAVKDEVEFPHNIEISAIKDMIDTIKKVKVPSKLPKELVSDDFPPSDIYINRDGSYCIECALAGYNSEQLSVIYKNEYIHLTIKERENEWRVPIQKGIKYLAEETVSHFYVDKEIFDITAIKTVLKNGLLQITIPKIFSEPKEMTISIFED
jgi:HSP20 family molecular chaperone IbpA